MNDDYKGLDLTPAHTSVSELCPLRVYILICYRELLWKVCENKRKPGGKVRVYYIVLGNSTTSRHWKPPTSTRSPQTSDNYMFLDKWACLLEDSTLCDPLDYVSIFILPSSLPESNCILYPFCTLSWKIMLS